MRSSADWDKFLRKFNLPEFRRDFADALVDEFSVSGVVNVKAFGAKGPPFDDTQAIQRAFDSGEKVILFTEMYLHTFNEVPDGVMILGQGRGTGLKQFPDIRYANVGGANTGPYGLTCKSGVTWWAVCNLEIDGNATESADWLGNDGQAGGWESIVNLSSAFEVGRYKQSNLGNDSLNRAGFVPPEVTIWRDIYSHDAARNCFLHQHGTLFYSGLHAKNAHLDHWFYSDSAEDAVGAGILCEGYCKGGGFTLANSQLSQVKVKNIVENPYTIASISEDLQIGFIVDDRSDQSVASAIDGLDVKGDLEAIDGSASPLRRIIKSTAHGANYNNIRVEHTEATDPAVIGLSLEGTLAVPGTVDQVTLSNFSGFSLPGNFQLFVQDPQAYGVSVLGVKIQNVQWTYRPSVILADLAIVEFNGAKMVGFVMSGYDAAVENNPGNEGGPGRLFDHNLTGEFSSIAFENGKRAASDNAYQICQITTGGAQTFDSIHVHNDVSRNLTPTGDALSNIQYRDCKFFDGYSDVKGTATFSGDGVTTNFIIALTTGTETMEPAPTFAWVQKVETDAGPGDPLDRIDVIRKQTGSGKGAIRVTYATAPPSATDNVIIQYMASIS